MWGKITVLIKMLGFLPIFQDFAHGGHGLIRAKVKAFCSSETFDFFIDNPYPSCDDPNEIYRGLPGSVYGENVNAGNSIGRRTCGYPD